MQPKTFVLPLSLAAVLLSAAVRAEPETAVTPTTIEVSPAIPAAELSKKAKAAKIELQEVRKKITHAQKDLKTKQVQQQRAKKLIDQTALALNKVRQELAALNQQQRMSWGKLQALQNELNRLQTEVGNTKAQVARLLVSNYKNQQPSAVVLLLKHTDAAQKSRLLQYSRYINQANDRVLKQLAEQQQQLNRQQAAINAELARLKKLTAQAQAKLKQLGSAHHAAVSDNRLLAAEIQRQSSTIGQLRQNERNLNGVIAQIGARRAAQQRAEAAARKKAAQAAAKAGGKAKTPPPPKAAAGGVHGLSRLQGRLGRPVAGNISGRFGQPRPDGGTWRGIFIETAPAGVQSIAAGEVAYAAELRGYGNTVIVDHGDGYLSIYTGLNSISVSSGSRVGARQTLGSSGSVAGVGQGLYFEIRYRNRAMNPLAWIR